MYSHPARRFDRAAADSTDAFLTQSPFTAGQIRQAYRRDAQVLAPPVDCGVFTPSGEAPGGYFLFVGRLVEAYKRPSIVVEAFSRMPDKQLLIVGDGPAMGTLTAMATPNIHFLGQLTDPELVPLMQGCQAAIFPSIDDYGLVPLEVNACGRPVLAVPAGGSLHTVRPGITGEFMAGQTTESIVASVEAFDPDRYDPVRIRAHAYERSSTRFREEIRHAAERLVNAPAPAIQIVASPVAQPARALLASSG
jgi:glycosyltransferase involved in cell wall biosynthesis